MIEGLTRIDEARARHYRDEGLWTTETVDQLVLAPARTRPDAPALVAHGRRLTHGELAVAVAAAGARLRALGLRRGDPVVVQLPNDLELVVLTLALGRLGAPPIMTPVQLREAELEHLVGLVAPVAIAVPGMLGRFDHAGLARRLRASHPSVRTLLIAGGDDDRSGEVDLRALCAPPEPGEELLVEPLAEPGDPAVCLLSNGTTGRPKVIPRLQEAYAYQLRTTPEVSAVGPDSVYLAVLGATHGFVLGCPGVLGTLGAGGRVVLAGSSEPSEVFALIERERVTHSTLVPALVERWIDAAATTTADLSSLQVLQVGGARPRRGQIERAPEVLGLRVQQCYGMSEGLLCYTALDDADDVVLDTQGRPLSPHDEVRLIGPDGAPVADGEIGELQTRGPYTIAGYYRDAGADAEAFTADGFYRTGDLARRDASGSVVIEGRTRDVINRGGEKIPSAELELLAAEHPDVLAAVVVGVPDERYGEVVCLCLCVREGGDPPTLLTIRRFLRDRGLARFKLPERVEIIDEIPYRGIGKADKKQLRAMLAAC